MVEFRMYNVSGLMYRVGRVTIEVEGCTPRKTWMFIPCNEHGELDLHAQKLGMNASYDNLRTYREVETRLYLDGIKHVNGSRENGMG